MSKHFVIDTNTLVSAFLFKNSKPRKALHKAIETGKILVSTGTYNEFEDVFMRPKFDKYVRREMRLLTVKEFEQIVMFKEVTETITVCRDPKDDKFLELAVAANAACIITGDDDLLVMHPFRNISILNASDFLATF